jgi:hypothetical protein
MKHLELSKGQKAQSWCNKNGIYIYPIVNLNAPRYNEGKNNIPKVQIEINNKGKRNIDKNYYKQNLELSKKIEEYYIYYFVG